MIESKVGFTDNDRGLNLWGEHNLICGSCIVETPWMTHHLVPWRGQPDWRSETVKWPIAVITQSAQPWRSDHTHEHRTVNARTRPRSVEADDTLSGPGSWCARTLATVLQTTGLPPQLLTRSLFLRGYDTLPQPSYQHFGFYFLLKIHAIYVFIV